MISMLQKLERKLGRFAIHNLMMVIVVAMGAVFVLGLLSPINLAFHFAFDTAAIMRGEVWRVITFVFVPPAANMMFMIFALYFYWLVGSALEREWGAFRFNVFYLCGIVGTIIAGLITGFATNFYLNLSLFLAFAILYPNFEVRLFFILPVKMKWLAFINTALLAYLFIFDTWPGRVALLVSILNIILFFWRDFMFFIKRRRKSW